MAIDVAPILPLYGPEPGVTRKEWLHCVVFTPTGPLIANFSLDYLHGADGGHVLRSVVLARQGDGWVGEARRTARGRFARGRGELIFDDDNGLFATAQGPELRLRSRAVEARLTLRPRMAPTPPSRTIAPGGLRFNWSAVPAVAAGGRLRVGDRIQRLNACSAYRDHNWGHFDWGGSLGWEWGCTACSEEWALVWMRTTDRARTREFGRTVLLWHRGRNVRSWHGPELAWQSEGDAAMPAPTFPPQLGLLAPTASGAPARLRIRGPGLELVVETRSVACVAVPDEDDPMGMTRILEVEARATLRAEVFGEGIAFETPAVAEYVRG